MTAPATYVEAQEAQQAVLLAELAELGAGDLCRRLEACRTCRAEQRAAGDRPDLRDVVAGRARYRCRSYACWRCRPGRQRRDARRYAAPFRDASVEDCTLLTLADSLTGDLAMVRDRVGQIRRALRDRRDSMAAGRPRWRDVEAVGYVELDALMAGRQALLLPDQRALIGRLPVLVDAAAAHEPLWVVRVHLVVHHRGISRDALHRVLAEQWPTPGAVHLKPFDGVLAVEDAGRILSYTTKHTFRAVADEDSSDRHWLVEWQARYWAWLDGMGRGLQPLRIALGPMRDRPADSMSLPSDDDADCDEGDDSDSGWDDPLPFIVG